MKATIRLVTHCIGVVALLMTIQPAFTTAQQEQKTLNFALSGDPDTLDPHKTSGTLTFQTVRSIYDTLVEPDMHGKLVPALAERWESSGNRWTFHLRKSVFFHNGDPLTAADVKATIERIMSEDIASPKASEFQAIESVTTPDQYTVEVQLSSPIPLLASLASGWGAILSKRLIDAEHDFGSQPVGTGPFEFVSWDRDSKISLKKNPRYWMAGAPKLDRLDLHIIPEKSVQLQGLLSGQIDISYIVDLDDVPVLEAEPEVRIENILTSLVMVLGMNCSKPPLDDLRVRQAINHAIDKQKALEVAYGGGEVVGTFMDYGNVYYKDFTAYYPYDPQRARQLLAQADIEKKRVLEIAVPQNYAPHVKAGEIYHAMLSAVGLNVKLRLVDWSTWLADVYKGGKYDLTVIGHTGKLDPDLRLGGYGTPNTYVRWEHAQVADLLSRAKLSADFDSRKTLYHEALEVFAREVPHVYVGSSYRYIALRRQIVDFRIDPIIDTFDFRWTDKTTRP